MGALPHRPVRFPPQSGHKVRLKFMKCDSLNYPGKPF